MRAIILDDEKNCIDVISALAEKYTPELNIVETFQNGEEAVKVIEEIRPEIVFLDIEMPRMNGFEFLEETPYKKFKVIFTTAYNEYAIKAIKHHAFDYLLKPIRRKEFIETIDRLKREKKPDSVGSIELLLSQIAQKTSTKKISLSTSEGTHIISTDDIIYAKAESAYTCCYKKDGSKLLISKTLKEVEEIISHQNFLRIHASYLVNFDFVSKYNRADGGYLELLNGDILPISRSRKADLVQFMDELNG